MGRLEIGNENDIKKVIRYERNLGLNRLTNKQKTLEEYEIDFCITISDTITVEGYDEDSACDIAIRELESNSNYDIADFDPTIVRVYDDDDDDEENVW